MLLSASSARKEEGEEERGEDVGEGGAEKRE